MTSPARRALVLALLAAIALAGCATPTTEVTVDGASWTLLRDDGDGMRGRADFGGTDGMLFDVGKTVQPTAVVFVMDGVSMPLDIAWFDETGALVGVGSMVPCPEEPCPHYAAPAPYRWAIEAPPGAFASLSDDARLDVPGTD